MGFLWDCYVLEKYTDDVDLIEDKHIFYPGIIIPNKGEDIKNEEILDKIEGVFDSI